MQRLITFEFDSIELPLDAKLAKIEEQIKLAFEFYNLNWNFDFDYSVTKSGSCTNTKRNIDINKITLSIPFIELNNEAIIINEIRRYLSKAIDLNYRNSTANDGVWKQIAESIGFDVKITSKMVKLPDGKFKYKCFVCENTTSFHRKLRASKKCDVCFKKDKKSTHVIYLI